VAEAQDRIFLVAAALDVQSRAETEGAAADQADPETVVRRLEARLAAGAADIDDRPEADFILLRAGKFGNESRTRAKGDDPAALAIVLRGGRRGGGKGRQDGGKGEAPGEYGLP